MVFKEQPHGNIGLIERSRDSRLDLVEPIESYWEVGRLSRK